MTVNSDLFTQEFAKKVGNFSRFPEIGKKYKIFKIVFFLFHCRYGSGGFGSRDYRQFSSPRERSSGGGGGQRNSSSNSYSSTPNFGGYGGNQYPNQFRNNYGGASSNDWWGS